MADANDQKRLEGITKEAYAKPRKSEKRKVFSKIMKMMGK